MKTDFRRLCSLVATAGVLLFGAVTVQATCGTAFDSCVDATERLYKNCADSIAALYARIRAAADNYTSTIANIDQDDPDRATKIKNAKDRFDSTIDESYTQLAGLICEPLKQEIEECGDDLRACQDA